MSDADSLAQATRALRDGTTPSNEGIDEMLARISRGRRPVVNRSRARLRVASWAFAATLVGVGAWASAGGPLARLLRGTEEPKASAPAEPRQSLRPPIVGLGAAPPAAPLPSELAPVEEPRPDSLAPVEPPSPKPRPLAPASPAPSASAAAPTPSASRAIAADDSALYRTAHRLHFLERDWARALSAWDRYLAAAGSHGSMIVEARYNRGLVLARLGRKEEARQALHAFADGEYGGYRREEAARVIESLGR